MRSVSLRLEPGANVVTLVTPDDYTLYFRDLADLLAKGLGAEAELVGKVSSSTAFPIAKGLTFWVIGEARPVTMHVLLPTAARSEWYASLGSPVGPEPQYVALGIDWRGQPRTVDWASDTWVAPPGSKAVRGKANWPDYTTAEEYRKWLGEVKTAETISAVGGAIEGAIDGAVDKASGAMSKGVEALKWPIIGLSVAWIAYATRRLWLPKG